MVGVGCCPGCWWWWWEADGGEAGAGSSGAALAADMLAVGVGDCTASWVSEARGGEYCIQRIVQTRDSTSAVIRLETDTAWGVSTYGARTETRPGC